MFVLTGGGWGHGVGMSQWGAYGQAVQGRSFEQILATYYPGTVLGRHPRQVVRVLLREGATSVRVLAGAGYTVTDALGKRARFEPGERTLRDPLKVREAKGEPWLVPPLTFTPETGSQLSLDGTTYRGTFTVLADAGKLMVVNNVRLEAYLLGVVPSEMPVAWPLEALKAQAVAARTYAVRGLLKDRPFDLHADWRSQMYRGVAAEAPGPTQAVKETAGRVLLYEGKPATTFYHSSSGGHTRNAADVFGIDVPYLQGVDDPWDESSPRHRWETRVLTGKALAQMFALEAPVVDVSAELGRDGLAVLVRLEDAGGAVREVKVADVRTTMSLHSLSFRLGTLKLETDPATPTTVPPRARVMLAGTSREVEEPRLERLTPGGAWVPAPKLPVRPDGTFSVVVKPPVTSVYRLSGSGVPGPSVTVEVVSGPP